MSKQKSLRALSLFCWQLPCDLLILISAYRSTCRQLLGGAREASLAGLHPLPPQGRARPLSVRAMFSAIKKTSRLHYGGTRSSCFHQSLRQHRNTYSTYHIHKVLGGRGVLRILVSKQKVEKMFLR